MNNELAWPRLRIIYLNLCSEKTLEPFDRSFGISGEVVFIIDIVEPKSGTVPGCPFPIVQQRPRKIAAHVTPILAAHQYRLLTLIITFLLPWIYE